MMDSYKRLLLNNKAWVQEKLSLSKKYFEEMSKNQNPEFLWIGCSDSRVPANEVTGTQPGEIYVHRNVGNLIVNSDLNMLSVLQYAVEILKVKHIIVCGHYDCGGVDVALHQKDYGLLNKWLTHIKDVYTLHEDKLKDLEPKAKSDKLVELNVKEQVRNLIKSAIIQRSWANDNRPQLHGWVYDVNNGQLNDLIQLSPQDLKNDIYTYKFD